MRYTWNNQSKRTKVNDSRAYTSSLGADVSEGTVNRARPIEQKVAKCKGKEK